MDHKQHIFPFTAVQGQTRFKLALLLATVNPTLGGVLISGPRGSAKSTLARGVADLLPVERTQSPKLVTLPLGASEEMLIGTLDLEGVLQDKKVRFSPGLLQKADGGVLYVDEVNLLPDHLVDQLLDVASSGVNIVERDGISHRHRARFTLIGTMNPDEGALRPQLQDRFGLMVALDNHHPIEERINIIKTRQAFEADPALFCDQYQVQQILVQQQIRDAQALLPQVTCSDACFIEIATRCQQANVEGLRADIMLHRAALTHAAWCGRTQVTAEDIEEVAELVLVHREQGGAGNGGTPPNNDSAANNPPRGGFSRPTANNNSTQQTPPAEQSGQDKEEQQDRSQDQENSGEWGAMPAQEGQAQASARKLEINLPPLTSQSNSLPFNDAQHSKSKGRHNRGGHSSSLESEQLNWFATLSKSLGEWPPTQWVRKKQHSAEQRLHLILLDTSASTLSDSLSGIAKAVVAKITQGAYLQRDKVSLLGFGNDQVDTIIEAGRAPKQVYDLLDNISALGGTPLRLALQHAAQRIAQLALQFPSLALHCYLITDGRTRVDLQDLKLSVPTLLIDIERAQIKRGRGPQLASQLDAQYVALAG